MENTIHIDLGKMTHLLAEIGILLMSNGANTARTKRNITRIAEAYGYDIQAFFSHSAIIVTVHDKETNRRKTTVKNLLHHHVNYSIVSEVSILSWEIKEKQPSLEYVEKKVKEISKINSYPEWVKFTMIGVATASLSQIFDADLYEFVIAFLAAVAGFFGRKLLIVNKYNTYICWFFAAFVSASVVNLFRRLGVEHYQGALTACVLWLIPGAPLISGFLDILENHIVSGWARVAMGFMMVFMIAVGFYLSLFVFGYGYTV